jgi:dephospho-CoA kinase
VIVVGLTGSIGMGKSTTAQLFAEEGVPVFDADAAVHDLYRGQAVAKVEAAFPGVATSDGIDRELLSRRVVGDEPALRRLEAIVHPMVHRMREAFLAEARAAGAELAVVDIPLLFETGGEADVDAVALVSAPEAVQKARVMQRSGMTEERFAAIMARQVPDAEKRRRARFVIGTADGLEPARRQVRAVIAALKAEQGLAH